MSKIKKKTNKKSVLRLNVLAASVMMCMPMTHAAVDTTFATKPLVGSTASSFAPHVALAVSVEYPTAGAAYGDTIEFDLAKDAHTKTYLGYFDNTKCYKYNTTDGYFYPSSQAKQYGLCNDGGETAEFSGNMLNFMTMSSIDIFRSSMTGGNRAFGDGTNKNAYVKGDTDSATYLRRARVVSPGPKTNDGDNYTGINARQNGKNFTKMPYRRIAFNINSEEHKKTLFGLLPHDAIKGLLPDTKFGGNTANEALQDSRYQENIVSRGTAFNFNPVDGQVKKHKFTVYDRGMNIVSFNNSNEKRGNAKAQGDTAPGVQDYFWDYKIYFYNDGFGFRLGRHAMIAWLSKQEGNRYKQDKDGKYIFNQGQPVMEAIDKYKYASDGWDSSLGMAVSDRRTEQQKKDEVRPFYAEHDYLAIPSSTGFAPFRRSFNVVVKVCDKNMLDSGSLCVPYRNSSGQITHYKPEGLLQQYTKSHEMRFAALGYLNINTGNYNKNDTQADAAVLRARMKRLIGDPYSGSDKKYGAEWNDKGIFETNPDAADAVASGLSGDAANSGVINYINKFGDLSTYKDFDPGAELYHAALRYLMGNHEMTDDGSVKKGATPYQQTNLTESAKDGFPAIYDWDDPYTRDIRSEEQHCHRNSIIFIGDTSTHGEINVPEAAKTALTRLLELESRAYGKENASLDVGSSTDSPSKNYSPAYIAGLAYWARTHNMRPDLKVKLGDEWKDENNIYGSNFMIDVVEEQKYKSSSEGNNKSDILNRKLRNSFYLAAKYGGFSYDKTKTGQSNTMPATTEQWAIPAGGKGIVEQFNSDGGTPRNFAVANNPVAMKDALEAAFADSSALNNAAQAATGLSVTSGQVIDLTNKKMNITLQSTYNFSDLIGDVAASRISYASDKDKEKNPDKLLTDEQLWKLSDDVDRYHGSTFSGREHVFTSDANGNVLQFSSGNAGAFFTNLDESSYGKVNVNTLTNYVLGDKSLEGSTYRARKSLLGTFVNSTVQPIIAVKDNLPSCKYSDKDGGLSGVQGRGTHYVSASNNGFLHIFDENGKEKLAYIPRTALSKLPFFAQKNYTHQFLNDGTPVVGEVCFSNKVAKSVLLGVTGRGGKSVYALDVTNLAKASAENVLWEFNSDDDPDLGYTIASPVIANKKGDVPIAIVSGGYNSSGDSGHLFILNIDKSGDKSGKWVKDGNYKSIKLGNSSLGAPFVYDENKDGIPEKVFVGDVSGKMWQLNYNADNDTWVNPYGDQPLFDSGLGRPFSSAPYAEKINGKLIVVAGTGQYLSEQDLSTEQQNYLFGLIVDEERGVVDPSTLLAQSVYTQENTTDILRQANISTYASTDEKMTDKNQGWRVTLLKGQNIAANALIRKSKVAEFTAVRMLDSVKATCERAGTTSYLSFDVTNGGLYKDPIFDTNRDGKHDGKDVNSSVYEIKGMVTSQSTLLLVGDGTQNKSLIRGTDGGRTVDVELNGLDSLVGGVRRISWREIF